MAAHPPDDDRLDPFVGWENPSIPAKRLPGQAPDLSRGSPPAQKIAGASSLRKGEEESLCLSRAEDLPLIKGEKYVPLFESGI